MKFINSIPTAVENARNHSSAGLSTTNAASPNTNDTILIDCRNSKEYAIGHFRNAINPNTRTFSQFPSWVKENRDLLQQKNVVMYCTGGIRCEKASAFIRKEVEVQSVQHLKGGIHKYLEEFGGATNIPESDKAKESLWEGKNFVFDGRIATDAPFVATTEATRDTTDTHLKQDKHCGTKNISMNGNNSITKIVGKCVYCQQPHDMFYPHIVCTVCREPTLVCPACSSQPCSSPSTCGTHTPRPKNNEYHCKTLHFHLRNCYFTNLQPFSIGELAEQKSELLCHYRDIEVGRKWKGRRNTLMKQIERVNQRIQELSSSSSSALTTCGDLPSQKTLVHNGKDAPQDAQKDGVKCRHCHSENCRDGMCWGFHGLARSKKLKEQEPRANPLPPGYTHHSNGTLENHHQHARNNTDETTKLDVDTTTPDDTQGDKPQDLIRQKRKSASHRISKQKRRLHDIAEITFQKLSQPPSFHRSTKTGMRCPPPLIRVLYSTVKGKWCGLDAKTVVQQEFGQTTSSLSSFDDKDGGRINLSESMERGLIRVNNIPLLPSQKGIKLKNTDVLSRIIHWHEPPVLVPPEIKYTRQTVTLMEDSNDATDISKNAKQCTIYAFDKSSTVPVHPTGTFLSNTLTHMAEGQLRLPPRSLFPCHRLDRPTSGLVLCCDDVDLARIVQTKMAGSTSLDKQKNNEVRKVYLARVKGKFPANRIECGNCTCFPLPRNHNIAAQWRWCDGKIHDEALPAPSTIASPANASHASNRKTTISPQFPSFAKPSFSLQNLSLVAQQSDVPTSCIEVNAPIGFTNNAQNKRHIDGDRGKPSTSRFMSLHYSENKDISYLVCSPITGRSHQLRVHLEYLGFPIWNDVLYGGIDDCNSLEKERSDKSSCSNHILNGGEFTRKRQAVQAICDSIAREEINKELSCLKKTIEYDDCSNISIDTSVHQEKQPNKNIHTVLTNSDRNADCVAAVTFDDANAAREVCPCCISFRNNDTINNTCGKNGSYDQSTHDMSEVGDDILDGYFHPTQLLGAGCQIDLHAYRYQIKLSDNIDGHQPKKKKKKQRVVLSPILVQERVGATIPSIDHNKNNTASVTAIKSQDAKAFINDGVNQHNFHSNKTGLVLDFKTELPSWWYTQDAPDSLSSSIIAPLETNITR